MRVCGFSFIRNGMKFDYPFREALLSIVPICDEIFVAVGNSEDDTLNTVRSLHPKIKVIETVWDDSIKTGGKVLAVETDKAFQAIPAMYDWAFYIQGDEVLHEKYIPVVKRALEENLNEKNVDGLLFNYLHFFGSYDYVGAKLSWYRREVRVVRNNKKIYSYRDAQGFRKDNNIKLDTKLIDAWIYHYGWVRTPQAMLSKIKSSKQLYCGDDATRDVEFEYSESHEPVVRFDGTHPLLMNDRIQQKNWNFIPNENLQTLSLKNKIRRMIANLTGWIPGEYRNYRLVK